MLKRSETLFVHQVTADRRKRVVNTLYSSFDSVDRVILFLRILAACDVCAGAAGMVYHDLSWGYRCSWTSTAWAGVIVWATCGAIRALRSMGLLDFANSFGLSAPMTPGAVVDTHALSGVANFTCRLGGACLVSIATVATITHYGYINPKTDAAVTTCLVSGLLLNALLLQISFKSFSGLYAPVLPQRCAPTVLPIFALSTGASAVCTACVGLQFQPQSLDTLRLINIFRLLAWSQWLLEALGTFNVCYLVRQRAEKLTRGQQHDYYNRERTPLTGNNTPQIKQ